MLIEVICDVLNPFLMTQVVNHGVLTGDMAAVRYYGLLMIATSVVSMITGSSASFASSYSAQGFGMNLRQAMYEKISTYSFRSLDRFGTATLITRLTTDITRLSQVVDMTLRMGVRAPMLLIMATFMALQIDAELALVFLVAAPILAFLLYRIMRFAFPQFSLLQKIVDKLNQVVNENLDGIRVVKGFVREETEKEKFQSANADVRTVSIRIFNVMVMAMPLMALMMYASTIAILWFGGVKITLGNLQAGDLIGFLSYIIQVFVSLTMVTVLLVNYVRARASAVRCLEVLDEDVDLVSPPDGRMDVCDGDILFSDVSFRYDGTVVDTLCNADVHIKHGELIGIIGSTGSGKSTFVNLIPRLYDVDRGSLKVSGVDVRDYDLKALRDAVAIVLQKNTLFSGTIRENLKWGDEDATDEELWRVLELADAKEFVANKEGGLDHAVEPGGTNFSGGQRQRLSIARTLLKKPKVLILDDAMSALDMATERKVRLQLRAYLHDTTVLLIAQRISTVEKCDRIIVMDAGRIESVGTHAELLHLSPIYREINDSQKEGLVS